jgi:predicted MFS family arabinose efflux permease
MSEEVANVLVGQADTIRTRLEALIRLPRSAITQVTLYGGFASTVCWPLSAFLLERFGWRATCLVYAAIQLALILPLYLAALPAEQERRPAPKASASASTAAGTRMPIFLLVGTAMTLAAMTMAVVSVHLLTVLQARGLGLAAAVAIGAFLGPSAVAARFFEGLVGKRAHPVWTMVASTTLVTVGVGLLLVEPSLAAVAVALYGAGSGLRSIARGTLPLALFGKDGYATLMGKLAMPALVSQATAPTLGAWLLDSFGVSVTLGALLAATVVNVALALAVLPYAYGKRLSA